MESLSSTAKKTINPTPLELKAKQDYTKVGGWLKFFGITAGVAFLIHCYIFAVNQDRCFEIMCQTNAKDAGVFELAQAFGLLLPFIALAQCFCIFQRRRLGRTLSLVFYGYITLYNLAYNLITLRFRITSFDADPTAFIMLHLAAIAGVVIHAAPFAYFLFSERVEKTLVN